MSDKTASRKAIKDLDRNVRRMVRAFWAIPKSQRGKVWAGLGIKAGLLRRPEGEK